jgi:hypothetical protein
MHCEEKLELRSHNTNCINQWKSTFWINPISQTSVNRAVEREVSCSIITDRWSNNLATTQKIIKQLHEDMCV